MNNLETRLKTSHSAEQRLATVGAKIDKLVEAAAKAKDTLFASEQMAFTHGELCLKEMHEGLEKAWAELSSAWKKHEQELGKQSDAKPEKGEEDEFPETC